MRNFLRFVVQLPHPSLAGSTIEADYYLPQADILCVEDVTENGTGKRGVQIVAGGPAGPYARVVLMGYKSADVIAALSYTDGPSIEVKRTFAPALVQ